MRSTYEQFQEIMRRAETVKEKRGIRRNLYAGTAASLVCVVLLVVVCACLPRLNAVSQDLSVQRYGSLLLAAPYMGYVIIGVISFALGICVTLLCVQWKKLKQKEQDGK